jgi:PAS domain S-box-containing protein
MMRKPLHPLFAVLAILTATVLATWVGHLTVSMEQNPHKSWLLGEAFLGILLGALLVYSLIRMRQQAETRLQESMERFRSIVEGAQAGYFRIDVNGRLVDENPAFLALHRMRSGVESRGRLFEDLVIPSDRARARGLVLQSLGGRTVSAAELARDLGGGKVGFETISLRPVQERGQISGAEGFLIDTSDLRRAQSDYRGLFESMLDAFALHEILVDETDGTVDYRFLRVNPSFEALTGRKADELVGKTAREVFPGLEPAWFERYRDVALTGRPARFREFASHIGKWVEVVAFSPERGRFGTVIQDITLAHEAEKEREALEERLRQSEKMDAIGQLAGGVAHDFNNMLAGIMGYGDLLRRKLQDPSLRQHADAIVTASQRAADLTAKLLAFARKGKIQAAVVDMHVVVGEVLGILERTIDKRIRIRKDLAAELSVVRGDPSQLQNAVLNLAINARDAMPEGGEFLVSTKTVDLDDEFCLSLSGQPKPGLHIEMHFRDTGTGMSEEVRKRIFEPFFTTKEAGKGTGMGLAAVWGSMVQHHGAILVRSIPGEGTEFILWFPLDAQSKVPETTHELEISAREGKRILIVDDEQLVRDATSSTLLELGYAVETAKGGEEAVVRVKARPGWYDLVLLDMIMPRTGGPETFRMLRQAQPDVKVLLVSGYSLGGEAQGLLETGAAGFLQKPWNTAELSRAVAKALVRASDTSSLRRSEIFNTTETTSIRRPPRE